MSFFQLCASRRKPRRLPAWLQTHRATLAFAVTGQVIIEPTS